MNIRYLLIALLSFQLQSTIAQTNPDPNFHLYVLAGQSNMAGRGKVTDHFKTDSNIRVMVLNKQNEWVMAKHPLHFDKREAGVGPGLSFGIAMAENNPKKVKIGLIPCAVGGTPIEDWKPGAYNKATNTYPYDDAIVRIKKAMEAGIIKGIIWHQGEGNSNKSASTYISKLTELILGFRKETGDPNLPFVAGELGRYKEVYQLINTELVKLPSTVQFTGVVSSEGLVHNGDGTHLDSPSAQEFGKRFASEMKMLQKKAKRK